MNNILDRKVPFAETEATVVFDWEKGTGDSAMIYITQCYINALNVQRSLKAMHRIQYAVCTIFFYTCGQVICCAPPYV
jgi:hypothetical protein